MHTTMAAVFVCAFRQRISHAREDSGNPVGTSAGGVGILYFFFRNQCRVANSSTFHCDRNRFVTKWSMSGCIAAGCCGSSCNRRYCLSSCARESCRISDGRVRGGGSGRSSCASSPLCIPVGNASSTGGRTLRCRRANEGSIRIHHSLLKTQTPLIVTN